VEYLISTQEFNCSLVKYKAESDPAIYLKSSSLVIELDKVIAGGILLSDTIGRFS
jgi:hypothetical protein